MLRTKDEGLKIKKLKLKRRFTCTIVKLKLKMLNTSSKELEITFIGTYLVCTVKDTKYTESSTTSRSNEILFFVRKRKGI